MRKIGIFIASAFFLSVHSQSFAQNHIKEPLRKSVSGVAKQPMRELRDPAIFVDEGKTWLLYSVAGEKGIAIAEIKF